MAEKVVYLIRESAGTMNHNWFGIVHGKGGGPLEPAEDAARDLRRLRAEGYEIIDTGFSLEDVTPDYYKFRHLNGEDRKLLETWDKILASREKYPHLNDNEIPLIERLEGEKSGDGVLWVTDAGLITPKKLKFYKREHIEIETTYHLSVDGARLAGRWSIDQYCDVLGHFQDVLSLRNAEEDEAKQFAEIGRPLNPDELESIVKKGITIKEEVKGV